MDQKDRKETDTLNGELKARYPARWGGAELMTEMTPSVARVHSGDQPSKGKILRRELCPAAWPGEAGEGLKIYVGQCSEEQQLLSPWRTE